MESVSATTISQQELDNNITSSIIGLNNNKNNPYGIVEHDDFKQFLETLAHQTRGFNLDGTRHEEIFFETVTRHEENTASNNAQSSNQMITADYSPLPDHHFNSIHQVVGKQRPSMHNMELLEDKYSSPDFNNPSLISSSIHPAAVTSPARSSSSSTNSWNVENDPVYDPHQLGTITSNWNLSTSKMMLDKLVSDLGYLLGTTCEDEQLNSVAEQILSDELLLINAVFHKQGSRYIIKLIKKIKRTDYVFTLTQILAPWFYQVTTHHTARFVVVSCMNYLGTGPNEVLYEQAISHVLELARNEVGCLSLKECIDTISGEQRKRLLNHVAYFSDCLSRDSYGNYVVQHVLQLKDCDINHKILKCLKGKFVALSQKKGGSYVVERCLECCLVGTDVVVREILMTSPNTPYQLAQHPTGNYVIQKALNRTKELCLSGLFEELVKLLEPHKRELIRFAGGKHVMNLMNDGSSMLP